MPWSTSSDLEDGYRFCTELKFLGVTGLKADDLKRAWGKQEHSRDFRKSHARMPAYQTNSHTHTKKDQYDFALSKTYKGIAVMIALSSVFYVMCSVE